MPEMQTREERHAMALGFGLPENYFDDDADDLAKEFNPDQSRDEEGRWDGDEGTSESSPSVDHSAIKDAIREARKERKGKGDALQPGINDIKGRGPQGNQMTGLLKGNIPILVSPVSVEDAQRYADVVREYEADHGGEGGYDLRTLEGPNVDVAFPAGAGLHKDMHDALEKAGFSKKWKLTEGAAISPGDLADAVGSNLGRFKGYERVGLAEHADFSKGDLPGHDFRGNQWVDGGHGDTTVFHGTAQEFETQITRQGLKRADVKMPNPVFTTRSLRLAERYAEDRGSHDDTRPGVPPYNAVVFEIQLPESARRDTVIRATKDFIEGQPATVLEVNRDIPASWIHVRSRVVDGKWQRLAKSDKDGRIYLVVCDAPMPVKKGDLPGHEFHGNQWTPGAGTSIYHVTRTETAKEIEARGLLPMQDTNWVQAGNKERYGDGDVFAFTHEDDAVRWAGKMDWEFNQGMGTGKISIVEMKTGARDKWKIDTSDPLTQANSKGPWVRSSGKVPASRVVGSKPVTSAMIRDLVTRDREGFGKGDLPGHEFRGNQWTSTPRSEWAKVGDRVVSSGGMKGTVQRVLPHRSLHQVRVLWDNGHNGLVRITTVRTIVEKGDLPGHEFRGNQWTGGHSAEVQKKLTDFEAAHAGDHIEHGLALLPDGTAMFGERGVVGNATSVYHTAEQMAAMRGKDVTYTHNHPNGSVISLTDMEFAYQLDLRELRAVTPKYVHTMRPGPGESWPQQLEVGRALRTMQEGIGRDNVRAGRDRSKPIPEHVALTRLSKELGLIYARKKR